MGKGQVGTSPDNDDSFRDAPIMAVQTPGTFGQWQLKVKMYILYDQQFHIWLYNYPEKLTHVHKETVPWLSRAAVFETEKKRS